MATISGSSGTTLGNVTTVTGTPSAGSEIVATSATAASWQVVGPTIIQTVNGNGTSPNLDFTAIPATYTHLQLLVVGRSSQAATNDTATLIVNNDTTAAHYDWVNIRGVSSAASSLNGGTGDASISITSITGNTMTANYASLVMIDAPFYAGTTWNKDLRVTNHWATAQTAAGVNALVVTGIWRNTVAITRLTLVLALGNWMTGSTGILYGVQ